MDFLNETRVSLGSSRIHVPENKFNNRSLRVNCPNVIGNQWKGEEAVNLELKKLATEMVQSQGFYDRFTRHFTENLAWIFKQEYVEYPEEETKEVTDAYIATLKDYQPAEIDIELEAVALNGHILIVNAGYYYEASKDGREAYYDDLWYEELYYFDLITGERVEPLQIFNQDQQAAFISEALLRVDKKWKGIINEETIRNGRPIFRGGSFYYLLLGTADVEYIYELNYQLRFELEEIQPFLDKNGPFGDYLNHKSEVPSISFAGEYESGAWYQQDFNGLIRQQYLSEEPVQKGFKRTEVYETDIRGNRSLSAQCWYNKRGQIIRRLSYKSGGKTRDSALYTYHPNGENKMIHVIYILKKSKYVDDDIELTEEKYHFNEQGNMTLYEDIEDGWNKFDDNFMSYLRYHFTYFGEKILVDISYDTPYGVGLYLDDDVEKYVVDNGYIVKVGRVEKNENSEYSLTRKGDLITYFMKRNTNEIRHEFLVKKGKIIAGTLSSEPLSTFNVSYLKNGKPSIYSTESTQKNGSVNKVDSQAFYDKNSNPVRLETTSTGDGKMTSSRMYEIEYFKK